MPAPATRQSVNWIAASAYASHAYPAPHGLLETTLQLTVQALLNELITPPQYTPSQ